MKTRNRILSIILALMLCIGMSPLIAFAAGPADYTLVLFGGEGYQNDTTGTEVPLSGLGITSLGDEINGYTYTFSGVNFETTAATAICIEDENATIKLANNSENTVKCGDALSNYTNGIYTEDNLTFSGSGKLNVIAGDAEYSSYGINVWGDIKVNGGVITVVGGNAVENSYGIDGDGNFAVEGGTVTASGGKATGDYGTSYGMRIREDFTVNGGTVTAKGNTAGRASFGIYTKVGEFTVTGGTVSGTGGEVTGTHGFRSLGICAAAVDVGAKGNFKVTGGTVNGTGGKAAEVSIGISAEGDFTVENGNVTAISDEARDKSYGIEADGNFTVSGGKVKGIGGEAKLDGFGLCAGSDAKITGGEVILSGSSVASGKNVYEAESAASVAPNTQVDGVNVMRVYGGETADGTDALLLTAWVGAGSDDVSSYKYLRFTQAHPVTVIHGTGSGEYAPGTTVAIKANEPESGMLFDKWVGADGLTFTAGSATTAEAKFTMPSAAVTVTATYKVMPVVATPVIHPNGGSFEDSQSVTITCETEGATIYYTTDGSEPTVNSTKYTGEFELTETTTIKAFAVKAEMQDSATASATFTKKEITSPPTGDNSNMALMFALLFVSSMGLVGTCLYGRKKRTN